MKLGSKKQQKILLKVKQKREGKALAKQRRDKRRIKDVHLWEN